MEGLEERIRAHWAERGDLQRIREMLKRRGLSTGELTPDDLSVLDQLHAGQLESTRLLAEWAQIEAGQRVLDVGAGLGGAARFLAWEKGCEVTALEPIPELHEAGRELTGWLELDELVEHRLGDVESFARDEGAGGFELILLQHVDMHIPEKVEAYKACRAVLAPSTASKVLWHDWLAGPGGELKLPVPWSRAEESITFLSSYDQLRADLVAAGLALHRFQPLQAETALWFSRSRDQIRRVVGKANVQGRAALEQLLAEVEGALVNLAEQRLIPFFAEARRVE